MTEKSKNFVLKLFFHWGNMRFKPGIACAILNKHDNVKKILM